MQLRQILIFTAQLSRGNGSRITTQPPLYQPGRPHSIGISVLLLRSGKAPTRLGSFALTIGKGWRGKLKVSS